MSEANEEYRRVADRCPTLVALDNDRAIGLVTVVHHSPHLAELHVMAVAPDHHRHGIGRLLVESVEQRLRAKAALGFRVLEEMPSLWDTDNPAVLLVKRV